MGLVFLISNFFIYKISHANKLSVKKVPTCGNSALVSYLLTFVWPAKYILLESMPWSRTCWISTLDWHENLTFISFREVKTQGQALQATSGKKHQKL